MVFKRFQTLSNKTKQFPLTWTNRMKLRPSSNAYLAASSTLARPSASAFFSTSSQRWWKVQFVGLNWQFKLIGMNQLIYDTITITYQWNVARFSAVTTWLVSTILHLTHKNVLLCRDFRRKAALGAGANNEEADVSANERSDRKRQPYIHFSTWIVL